MAMCVLSSLGRLTILDFVSLNLHQNQPPTRASVVIPVTGESEGAVVQVRFHGGFGAGRGTRKGLVHVTASMCSLPSEVLLQRPGQEADLRVMSPFAFVF